MKSYRFAALFLLAALTAVLLLSPVPAQTGPAAATEAGSAIGEPYLVKNINPRTSGSGVDCLAAGDAYALCRAFDGLPGTRLWRSDGTTTGTFLLKELSASELFVDLENTAVTASGKLFFTADHQLWQTDGTPGGTLLVKAFLSGSSPAHLAAIGETLYFVAPGDGLDTYDELWRSDGTEAGTAPFFAPPYGSFGEGLETHNGLLFFRHTTAAEGKELWVSDGSAANTKLLRDIYPGEADSEPEQLTVSGAHLYFVAKDGVHGRELWRSDGTETGTTLVMDHHAGEGDAQIVYLTSAGDLLFFMAFDGTEDALWSSDGTAGGLVKLTSDFWIESVLASADHLLYMVIGDKNSGAPYLARSDGTPEGTLLLLNVENDFMTGTDNPCLEPLHSRAAGSALYFSWASEEAGCELWRSDGSAAGTAMVQDVLPGPDSSYAVPLASVNDLMLLRMALYPTDDFSMEGLDNELGVTDGTPVGTELLLNINRLALSSEPNTMIYDGERLYFAANDGTVGPEIWLSDGAEAGTRLVRDIWPGRWGAGISGPAATGSGLVFASRSGATGGELYSSDGTAAGTQVIRTLAVDPHYAFVRQSAEWNGFGFFSVTRDPEGIHEFWRSDGTAAGTILLGDYYVEHMAPAANQLYFISRDASGDDGPYEAPAALGESDGTPAGTIRYAGLPVHDCSLPSRPLAVIGDRLYFAWCDSEGDTELWTLESASGTPRRVLDINPGGSSYPEQLAAYEGEVYFTADDGVHGPALWRSDGTAAGTLMVVDVPAWRITPYSAGFFFVADGLWVSDGTASGTTKIADFSDSLDGLTVAADHLFFVDTGFDEEAEYVLMASDGTAAGTGIVGTQAAAALPRTLTVAGSKLFFSAEDEWGDRELWALSLAALPPVAAFRAAPTSGPAPRAVQFRNDSSGGFDSCIWDFGDGVTANGCGAQQHTYSDQGTFTVTLSVSGPGGADTLVRDNFILIEVERATADFGVSPASGTRPLPVSFTNLSTGGFDSCTWEFGDGQSASGCTDQTHTYTGKGVYPVTLTVSGQGGSDTKTLAAAVTVYEPVTADFGASPTHGPPPLKVRFSSECQGDFQTMRWDFGDGSTANQQPNPSHTYRQEGRYTVTLKASGPGGEGSMVKEAYIVVESYRVFMPSVSRE